MGSRLTFYLTAPDDCTANATAAAAFRVVGAWERRLSPYDEQSELSDVNRRAYRETVVVSSEFARFLDASQELTALTDGAFDGTMGLLIREWGFWRRGVIAGNEIAPPDADMLAEIVGGIGWHHVEWNRAARTVRFLTPHVCLHPGAIGKGFVLDRAADVLRGHGVTTALLDCGGSTCAALGSPPDSDGWRIGIEHPETGEAFASVSLCDAALSTSSNGRQFVQHNGQRYGHLLDPRTGYPADSDLLSVSVMASEAAVSDALSTACFIRWTHDGSPRR